VNIGSRATAMMALRHQRELDQSQTTSERVAKAATSVKAGDQRRNPKARARPL
jgi:hypothetical protein